VQLTRDLANKANKANALGPAKNPDQFVQFFFRLIHYKGNWLIQIYPKNG